MQNEKNSPQDETTLTEAEISFAKTLEQSLTLALGDDDKVTSIWSRLKPEQRARIAEDYLAKLAKTEDTGDPRSDRNWSGIRANAALDAHAITQASASASGMEQSPATAPEQANKSTRPTHAGKTADNTYSPPPGYPADFNPLAGFPGLEPSRSGPSPEDIIAGALGGPGTASPIDPLDILRGIIPGGENPTLRHPIPQSPSTPPVEPPTQPQTSDAEHDQHVNAPQPGAQKETSAGPAAPNFWPLWIDQQDTLLKQCLKLMSGNMDDAQDALSEAMVKASTKFEDSMDEIRNHRAWLSRIVHNACIDLHRQNRRKAEYREETHGAADTPASPMTAPVTPSPEESYLAGEKLDQLETALLAMQEKLRKPLLMRCVQDRTYDEIASALGLSNCAVRKRVQLAREHLRASGIQ